MITRRVETENGRARKLSMLSWNRHKFRLRSQRRGIFDGKWWTQGRVGCRGCARLRRSIFHFNLGNLRPPLIPFPRASCRLLVPYPSSFAASLATSRICVSPSFTPSCFPLFPCLSAPHPVLPSLSPHSLPPSSLISLFFLLQAPMTLSSRRVKLFSHARRLALWSLMATTGSFKNSRLTARRAKVKYPRGSELSFSLTVKLCFTCRDSKLKIKKILYFEAPRTCRISSTK